MSGQTNSNVYLIPAATPDEEEVEEEVVNNNDSHGNPWLQEQPTNESTSYQSAFENENENPWDVSPAVTLSQSELSALSNLEKEESTTAKATATTSTNTSSAPLPPAEGNLLEFPGDDTTTATTPAIAPSSSQLTSSVPLEKALSQPSPETMAPTVVPHSLTQVNSNNRYPNLALNATTATQSQLSPPLQGGGGGGAADDPSTAADYQEGGRLWQAALKEAEKQGKKPAKRSKFAETLMDRTRSRADPNALVSPNASTIPGKASMVTLGDNDGAFILSTALAKKRVRVVQLLLIGLVGLLLGLLGNFFVSTSCHFATVNIMVGQNEKLFQFHFGLWKYSPIESVFQGYPYCYKYDQDYANDAPIVARTANIVALVAGLIAISILWLYLIFGSTDKRQWKFAVRIAVVAALVQLSTMYFFYGRICQEYSCELGPGAYLSIFTSVVWLVLACEMHYHMPVAMYATGGGGNEGNIGAMEEPRALVGTMELTHVDDVAREYITRVTGKSKEDELPSLKTDLKRVRPSPNPLYSPAGTASISKGNSFYLASQRGTYQAPDPGLWEDTL